MRQMACKPGSVLRSREGMAIPLGRSLPNASRDLPGRLPGNGLRAIPIWSCSRWGLPCRDRCRPRGALLPHRFTLARLRPFRGFGAAGLSACRAVAAQAAKAGGLFSVALSLGLPPPDVIRHRVSVEPGLSSRLRLRLRRGEPSRACRAEVAKQRRRAAIRPSDAGTLYIAQQQSASAQSVRSLPMKTTGPVGCPVGDPPGGSTLTASEASARSSVGKSFTRSTPLAGMTPSACGRETLG
jgi:hypothetical protein